MAASAPRDSLLRAFGLMLFGAEGVESTGGGWTLGVWHHDGEGFLCGEAGGLQRVIEVIGGGFRFYLSL